MNPKAYRLPTYAVPQRYDIHLHAGLGSDEFGGTVAIALDIREARDSIELHARELEIPQAQIEAGGRTLRGTVQLDAERQVASITFAEPLPAGNATLSLAFAGHLSKGLEGLYLAKDGPEELICTQCEATEARRIFPCFDEPAFKAQFAWQVTTAAAATVLANGPLQSVEEHADTGQKTWTFAPTKPMSSYLIALVIGDVAGTSEEVVREIPIRVWALRGKERMGEFAHAYTTRLLPWYEDYFGAPYHFDKYDQVAVPGFGAGAMENSGLVLFRQALLLMDPRTVSWGQEKSIAHVIAHEFAHMWFGNLVTMRWWDDLWLNEAFAEWIAYKAVDALSPDYEIWDDAQRSMASALQTDALESTHPIYSPVETAAEADEMFDSITYAKGYSVLRMLENFLGAEVFRAGLRTYMREFSERNAVGADLWHHLQSASQMPVTAIMQSWITQAGYPCLDAALETTDDQTALHVTQHRFFSRPGAGADDGQTWNVPLVIRYEDEDGAHETRQLSAEREAAVTLDLHGDLRWCCANAGEIGFHRQNLERGLLDRLLANLDRLATGEQMGLLDDQWALTRNATRGIGQFLDVLAAMAGIDNHHVLGQIVGYLQRIQDLLEEAGDDEARRSFREWVAASCGTKLSELGYAPRAGESQNQSQQRMHLVRAMAMLAQAPEAVAAAEQWQQREAEDPAAVDPNLAPVFVGAAAQVGDAARYDRYVAIYQRRRASGATPQESDRYLHSFSRFRAPELAGRTLELIDERVIPQENIGPVLAQMFGQRHARPAAWSYVKREWENLKIVGPLWIGFLVEASGQLPVTLRDEFVAFYDAHLHGLAPKSYARALEAMDLRAEFEARTRDELIAWFKRR